MVAGQGLQRFTRHCGRSMADEGQGNAQESSIGEERGGRTRVNGLWVVTHTADEL